MLLMCRRCSSNQMATAISYRHQAGAWSTSGKSTSPVVRLQGSWWVYSCLCWAFCRMQKWGPSWQAVWSNMEDRIWLWRPLRIITLLLHLPCPQNVQCRQPLYSLAAGVVLPPPGASGWLWASVRGKGLPPALEVACGTFTRPAPVGHPSTPAGMDRIGPSMMKRTSFQALCIRRVLTGCRT